MATSPAPARPGRRAALEVCDRRDRFAAQHCQRGDAVHVGDRPEHRLDAQAGQAAQLLDQGLHLRAALAEIELKSYSAAACAMGGRVAPRCGGHRPRGSC